jgi:hypothetical protein
MSFWLLLVRPVVPLTGLMWYEFNLVTGKGPNLYQSW